MPAIYDDWEAAYDACREANAPLLVRVDGETAKIFPSGGFKPILSPLISSVDPIDVALDGADSEIDLERKR